MEELRKQAVKELNGYSAFKTANPYIQEQWINSWLIAYKKGQISEIETAEKYFAPANHIISETQKYFQ